MNIKRAKQEIKDSIQAYLLKNEYGEYEIPVIRQRPILLIGAPGIGKTQIMEQIARECKIGLVAYTITHHTRQSAIGLPFISRKEYEGEERAVTEYTMSEIVASVYEEMKKTGLKEGILFIDEINCVSETLAPAMLQFLQCKTFGSHAIPQGWIIVAAGNPPEYNRSVREFDLVTLDRVKKIDVTPDFAVWKEYAYTAGVHPAVISYLNIRRQYFYLMETTVDGKLFATPRGWEDLSRLLTVYEKLGKEMDWEVVGQYIQHPKAAKDFANYLELYRKYQTDYQIEAVLEGTIEPILQKKAAHASFDENAGRCPGNHAVCGRQQCGYCHRQGGRAGQLRRVVGLSHAGRAAAGRGRPYCRNPRCAAGADFGPVMPPAHTLQSFGRGFLDFCREPLLFYAYGNGILDFCIAGCYTGFNVHEIADLLRKAQKIESRPLFSDGWRY